MEEDHSAADLQEAHDYRGDLFAGALETLEEDSGGDDRGAGEEDVVGGCYEGGVENVQCFLLLLALTLVKV